MFQEFQVFQDFQEFQDFQDFLGLQLTVLLAILAILALLVLLVLLALLVMTCELPLQLVFELLVVCPLQNFAELKPVAVPGPAVDRQLEPVAAMRPVVVMLVLLQLIVVFALPLV